MRALTRASIAAVARAAATIERPPGVARHGGCAAIAAAATVVSRDGDASAGVSSGIYRQRVSQAGRLGSIGGNAYIQRCAVGFSLPSCSLVPLASFSSGGRIGNDSLPEGKKVRLIITASTSVGELLSVFKKHQDLSVKNLGVSWHRLAELLDGDGRNGQVARRGDGEDVASAIWHLSGQTVRMASKMGPQNLSITLRGLAKVVQTGVEVKSTAAVVPVLIKEAARVSFDMNPKDLTNTLYAMAKLVEKEVEVDAAAAQAVSKEVFHMASEMNPHQVSQTLWAVAKLEEKGLKVNAAVVVPVLSKAAARVVNQMNSHGVSHTLWAVAMLVEKEVEVDAAAVVRAVSEEVVSEMNYPQDLSNALWAVAKLEEKGRVVDAATHRAVDTIKWVLEEKK